MCVGRLSFLTDFDSDGHLQDCGCDECRLETQPIHEVPTQYSACTPAIKCEGDKASERACYGANESLSSHYMMRRSLIDWLRRGAHQLNTHTSFSAFQKPRWDCAQHRGTMWVRLTFSTCVRMAGKPASVC